MFTLDDRITARLTSPHYPRWRAEVLSVGGCSRPIRLSGSSRVRDAATGTVLHAFTGTVLTACGTRREASCPSCSRVYAADAFHLVRAGLIGGTKGVPDTITDRPRAFLTLTAPSFGPVHNQPARTARARPAPCRCGTRHHDGDPILGSPVYPDSYDYTGAVLWQAHAGVLWSRFTTGLRRELARIAGIRVRDFPASARLSYGKVAEFQRRGLVHFHAIVRLDGPSGPHDPPPVWASDELLETAVRTAARSVVVHTIRPDGRDLELRWGDQLDIRGVGTRFDDERGGISEARLAAYIAKYATKGTGASETVDRPIRSERHLDHLNISLHHKTMMRVAWRLGALYHYRDLNLRRWCHMLGFRGHFLTKSRCYSTTFTAIRDERKNFRRDEAFAAHGITAPVDTVLVVNHWSFVGAGYRDDADTELAASIAARVRPTRKSLHARRNTR
ncbi:replication initiator [Amycolatopsis sp. H20-H5]|uniref:replication initiator n=1 Tax=Amycolatopsis sp. H20-H5 TaxID=3046309 RepID=UPI002DB5576B|nr:replication initiator [Amycolatopsis sp. H20-H5]MEC3974851.1 replication initiator [Amycolatopsis sp. H20-H5]